MNSSLRLTVDIGNTSTKLAIWSAGQIVDKKRVEKISRHTIEELVSATSNHKIKDVIVSSVKNGGWNEETVDLKYRCENFRVVHLSSNMPLPIKIDYKTPNTLGSDRIAALIGAQFIEPDENILVVDAGTAVTYDFISLSGHFEGGNIAPGISMRLNALHSYTSALPEVNVDGPLPLMGQSTDEAMRAGAIYGLVAEIESYRKWLSFNNQSIKVILTGGDSQLLGRLIEGCIVEPDLVMIGLNRVGDFIALELESQ